LFLELPLFAPFSQEPIRMTTGQFGRSGICAVVCVLALMSALAPDRAQSQEPTGTAVVHGYVRDSSLRPVANAAVYLLTGTWNQPFLAPNQVTHTDSEGHYRFAALRAGVYSLRAQMTGYDDAEMARVNVAENETTKIDLIVASTKASKLLGTTPATAETAKSSTPAPEFYDEPQFTVAGVTQATNSGGHGSDIVLRTTEALARATVTLSKESSGDSKAASAAENSLRDTLAREPQNFEANRRLGKLLVDNGKAAEALPYLERASRLNPGDDDNSYELALAYAGSGNPERARTEARALLVSQEKTPQAEAHRDRAEVHHLLGDVEEKLGNPLEAVREYQRAAELDPSELYLFDWGTELLTHRALEPATEVFANGNRRFPESVRMLVALGVAWYARGSCDQAAQYLVKASDLAPDNATPYLFLGKMQTVETAPLEGSAERLGRFVQLQPDNALANYYYAVSLWKQSAGGGDAARDNERSTRMEALLQKAVRLDPKLGAAYLQLGILYSQREDFSRAIAAYQKAIEVSPEGDATLEEAHYRLAQAYQRTGDKAQAKVQLQLHDELAKKTQEDRERKRREIQEFVIALRSKDSASQ
jgi:tetratricopeptide (TPR) repeat protein